MATLKTSSVNPSIVEDSLSRLLVRKERNKNDKVMDEVAVRLSRWKSFKKTSQGQMLVEIADPEIRYYQEMLRKPTTQLTHLGDVKVINECRAEWRGCLSVWESIKFNLVEYERKLKELNEMTKKEEEAIDKKKKAKLEKYR